MKIQIWKHSFILLTEFTINVGWFMHAIIPVPGYGPNTSVKQCCLAGEDGCGGGRGGGMTGVFYCSFFYLPGGAQDGCL